MRVSECVCEEGGREGRRTRRSGYRTKNKNPTRQCGEKLRRNVSKSMKQKWKSYEKFSIFMTCSAHRKMALESPRAPGNYEAICGFGSSLLRNLLPVYGTVDFEG